MNIQEILSVSSGTLAGMCGFSKYCQVDLIHNAWVEFELAYPSPEGANWWASWTRFFNSAAYQAACLAAITYAEENA